MHPNIYSKDNCKFNVWPESIFSFWSLITDKHLYFGEYDIKTFVEALEKVVNVYEYKH